MNAKERFLTALKLEAVDRPPVTSIATGITVALMEQVGIYWPAAHRDVDQLVGLAESIWTIAQIECIKLPFDMAVEVEALGAPVDDRTRDTLPSEARHIYNRPEELAIPADVMDRGRIPTVLAAIRRLRQRYDGEVAIVSSIVGPFSMAAKLFGFDNFLIWLIEKPDYVHQIMDALTPLAIRYAAAQVEAGADAITVGEATCSGDLISPRTYRDFIAPYHSRLCPAIPAPSLLHICGKSSGHLPYIATTGATAYSFDEGVDPKKAYEHLKGKVALIGYVPAVSVLLNGTPEETYRAARICLQDGVDVLNPGCAMAPYTPLANIAAMRRAALEWRGEQVQS